MPETQYPSYLELNLNHLKTSENISLISRFLFFNTKMLRTHTCGELRLQHINETTTLCGWVQGVRDKGALIWIDLRDRYGITQLAFNEDVDKDMNAQARSVAREYVIH